MVGWEVVAHPGLSSGPVFHSGGAQAGARAGGVKSGMEMGVMGVLVFFSLVPPTVEPREPPDHSCLGQVILRHLL